VTDAPGESVSLDLLARDIVARSGYRFSVAESDMERDAAYRLRHQAVVDHGWVEGGAGAAAKAGAGGRERDGYDDRAIHVLCWNGEDAIATGRLVLPPGSLPTEDVCGIRVEPRGQVADVGRMTVARTHQGPTHPVFVALLARLYLEVRDQGYDVACGIMSARARSLVRLLGLQLEVLGDDVMYWGEPRAPVRFSVTINSTPLATRWR
jgi:hypothetical protein